MADDLDAELLALAGDASDEEASPSAKQAADSPARSHSRSLEPSSTSRKATSKASRRGRKSRRGEEDGEVSDNSLQSASMSESDSGSDSEGSAPKVDGEGPIFPYDKLYYSSKDKSDIMAMPEIQREQILSERAQQVDRHNQDIALRRLLASREREEARQAKKNKRKASSAGVDDTQRKSSRQKTTLGGRKVGEASGAIEAYKRQREQKGKREEGRRRDPIKETSRAKDGGISEDDADGESEAEWDDRDRSPSPPKDDPPAELRDIQRARVGRSNFAQVCFYPGFDDAISGCYVRVNIGPNRDLGINEYRVCLIKSTFCKPPLDSGAVFVNLRPGFTEGKPYAMEGANGRSFITNQYAVLAHGKAEREFPFIACSDSSITESEFSRYRQTMAVEDCKMATQSMLADKVADINRLLNHKFTNEELNEKLRKQGSLDSKTFVYKRMETEKQIKTARAAGDEAEAERLEAELSQFSGPKLAFGSAPKPQANKPSEHERLAELNLRNQRLNYESVRRAQLDERKASKKAATRGQAKANGANGTSKVPPPKVDGPGDSRDDTPTTGPDTPGKANTPSITQKKAVKGGIAGIRHKNMDDENIAALDLDLDIEI